MGWIPHIHFTLCPFRYDAPYVYIVTNMSLFLLMIGLSNDELGLVPGLPNMSSRSSEESTSDDLSESESAEVDTGSEISNASSSQLSTSSSG